MQRNSKFFCLSLSLCSPFTTFAIMDTNNSISVVINTYNAERDLREVLESVKEFDEIVICDMESTDNTLDIAKEYGCKVVTFPKENHRIVEPARNFAIQSASSKWVLVVDADEIIPPCSANTYTGESKNPTALPDSISTAIINLWECIAATGRTTIY